MTQGQARRLLFVLVIAFAVAVTWPGVTIANRFRPTFFGLPFTMVWTAAWIVIGLIVLLVVDRALHGNRSRHDRDGRA